MSALAKDVFPYLPLSDAISRNEMQRPATEFSVRRSTSGTVALKGASLSGIGYSGVAIVGMGNVAGSSIGVYLNELSDVNGIVAFGDGASIVASGNMIWSSTGVVYQDQTIAEWYLRFQLTALLADFLASQCVEYSANVVARIQNLFDESVADDWQPLSIESLRGFLGFLKTVRPPNYPDITLTNDGNVLAGWGRALAKKITIEFTSADTVKYLYSYQDGDAQNRPHKHLGDEPLGNFLRLLDQMPIQIRRQLLGDGQ